MKLILILCTALIGGLLQADAQQQSHATCNALNETITNAADGASQGACTVDTECLVISCTGSAAGDFTITFSPCEDPVVVNFRIVGGSEHNITETTVIPIGLESGGGSGDIEQNATETIPIGLEGTFNITVEPLPDGLTFGASQMSIFVTEELFATTDIPFQCQAYNGSSLNSCLRACDRGTSAIQRFCRAIPHPVVRAACWAVQFSGPVACKGFCYLYWD